MAVAILILPLFDTLRVFVIRVFNGKSPFHPDRLHIHHLLIDIGLSHTQATALLFVTNVLFILLAIKLQHIGNLALLIVLLVAAVILSIIVSRVAKNKKEKTAE